MTTEQTGTCPVCNGTGRVDAGNGSYRTLCYGYRATDNTTICRNCGGQTMRMVATGVVPLRADGTPCTHDYIEDPGARRSGYHVYRCKHCNHMYDIDSGD